MTCSAAILSSSSNRYSRALWIVSFPYGGPSTFVVTVSSAYWSSPALSVTWLPPGTIDWANKTRPCMYSSTPTRSVCGRAGFVLDVLTVTLPARPARAVSKSLLAHASTWARASLTPRESELCDMTVSLSVWPGNVASEHALAPMLSRARVSCPRQAVITVGYGCPPARPAVLRGCRRRAELPPRRRAAASVPARAQQADRRAGDRAGRPAAAPATGARSA